VDGTERYEGPERTKFFGTAHLSPIFPLWYFAFGATPVQLPFIVYYFGFCFRFRPSHFTFGFPTSLSASTRFRPSHLLSAFLFRFRPLHFLVVAFSGGLGGERNQGASLFTMSLTSHSREGTTTINRVGARLG
jgi:hypothetical protein